ncbi:MAG: hypothetical protein ACYDBH_12320 [Acidobacteriaceae bacterium]
MANHAEVTAAEAHYAKEKESSRKQYIEELQKLDDAWQMATRKYHADKEAAEKAYELRNATLATELSKVRDSYDRDMGFIA